MEFGHFGVEFENSDQISIEATRDRELLVLPFTVPGSRVTIPQGSYTFGDVLALRAGSATPRLGHRRGSGGAILRRHDSVGDARHRRPCSGRITLLKQFSMEPTYSITRIDLPGGAFTTKLARVRVDYGFSPLMFASALLQYSSADRAFSSNLRFRWEYRPGSELFVVYTDERDTTADRLLTPTTIRGLKNRAFVVKVNRLLRF